jgi:hypothetical protein
VQQLQRVPALHPLGHGVEEVQRDRGVGEVVDRGLHQEQPVQAFSGAVVDGRVRRQDHRDDGRCQYQRGADPADGPHGPDTPLDAGRVPPDIGGEVDQLGRHSPQAPLGEPRGDPALEPSYGLEDRFRLQPLQRAHVWSLEPADPSLS